MVDVSFIWNTLSSIAFYMKWGFWILIVIGVITGLCVWIRNVRLYNKVVTIFSENNERGYFGKAKRTKDPNGTIWWLVKLKGFKKIKAVVPGKDCLRTLANGKEYAEGVLMQSGEIGWKTNANFIYGTLSAAEKAIMADEFESSAEWSAANKSGFDKFLEVMNMVFPLLVIALLVFGAGEYMAPAKDMIAQTSTLEGIRLQEVQILKEIKQDIREIKAEQQFSNGNRSSSKEIPQ